MHSTADHAPIDARDPLGAPYPPGVPVLAPGELVTGRALAALLAARDDGVRIAYARSPGLETIDVLVPDA